MSELSGLSGSICNTRRWLLPPLPHHPSCSGWPLPVAASCIPYFRAQARKQDHFCAKVVKQNEIGARGRSSLLCDGSEYFHNSLPIGWIRGYIVWRHPGNSLLKPELRKNVVVKAYNSDSNQSCNAESVDESNQLLSNTPKSEAGQNCSQLDTLESYFHKLNSPKAEQSSYSITSRSDRISGKTKRKDEYSLFNSKAEANKMTDFYSSKNIFSTSQENFNKLNTGTKKSVNSPINDYERDYSLFDEKSFMVLHTDDETSGFCLINSLAAINIAVLLFEVASPIRDSDLEYLSLPLMYGAKMNNLILSGEWWRLLTPMCLHSGLLHVVLGCWVLLTFGPRVCRAYGQVTFFLIYVLGGFCGNLTSFIHTPELTVCGTGPVFALIGAWLVYQSQNKEVIDKHIAENMFKQAVIATALSFILSSFGRIDNWTHLGATISGLIFGYLTCPNVELDNAAAKDGQKEAVALVQRHASPCKSIAIFTVSIVVLASFTLAYGMQIDRWDPSS